MSAQYTCKIVGKHVKGHLGRAKAGRGAARGEEDHGKTMTKAMHRSSLQPSSQACL